MIDEQTDPTIDKIEGGPIDFSRNVKFVQMSR